MYYLTKLLRQLKLKINRQKVIRAAGFLAVLLAITSIAPQKAETLGTEARGSKMEAGKDARSSNPENGDPSLQPPFSTPVSPPANASPQAVPAGSIQPLPSAPPIASISAQAAYIVDRETGTVLFEQNADARLPMASLTKIMTALVALQEFSLDEIVTVPPACADLPPNEMGLDAGEQINVEGLLYGMLVNSGSDAACALSHHYKGNFIGRMNQKAADLGLLNTHFTNETGLDGLNGNHYSAAKDLVKLSREALKNGVFRKIVGTRQANIPNANQTRWHALVSTNELLFTLPGVTGIKTGYTEQAKGCLAVSYEHEGREVIAVILGSEERFEDMEIILDWVFRAFGFPQ